MAKPSTITTAPELSISAPWVAGAAAIAVGYGASRCSSVEDGRLSSCADADADRWIPPTIALVLVLLAAIFYWKACSNISGRGAAVSIYPLGVQLSTVCRGIDPTVADLTRCRILPRVFIPRDRIVDCIVTEVIWSHKVQSMVVFRVSNRAPSSDDNAMQLVCAFPGVEMTYLECLHYRRQINSCLFGL
jgi:hypothetical protein